MTSTELANKLRRQCIELGYHSGENGAHFGGGLSTVEIFASLYNRVLKINPDNPADENRDRLIISKGHCVLPYYSALNHIGLLTHDELFSFETNGSPFHGHATRNLHKGIEFSGGSLSMGLSFAVGVALSCKKKNIDNHIYVIVGDGECNEGMIWEALMSASHYSLNNLTVIVDNNKLQYDGNTSDILNMSSLKNKFEAFGFNTFEIDGHNCDELDEVLLKRSDKPHAVIAHTVKGKGVSFMENAKEWHHHTLSKKEYEQALRELL